MSDERGLFGENEPIDLGSNATFADLPDFSSDDFDSIFGTAEKKDDAQTESAEVKSETPAPTITEKLEETHANEETTTVSILLTVPSSFFVIAGQPIFMHIPHFLHFSAST